MSAQILSRLIQKLVIVLLSLLVAYGLLWGTPQAAAGPETAPEALSVGLLTVAGSDPMTQSFNSMALAGLQRAEDDFGISQKVYASVSTADYAPNLEKCFQDGNALCLGLAFSMASDLSAAAATHPGVKYALIDSVFDTYPSNLRGVTFDVNQAAYLAGVLAGSMSQTKKLGAIGGMEIESVTDFTEPFANGASCASPKATALLTYTGSFNDPTAGAAAANALMGDGADVILAVAGWTGTSAVQTATSAGAWGIGSDVDYYEAVYLNGTQPGSDKLLTSVLKRIDAGVYQSVKDVSNNSFTSGTVRYGLAVDGVGLAPFHQAENAISIQIKARLEQVRQDLASGVLNPNSSVCRFTLYLPLGIR